MFTGKSNANASVDWNDLFIWNKYEDMTNLNVDWKQQVSIESLGEKRILAMSSGEMPDVFYASRLSNSEIYRYGKHDVFIKLNDLIDAYAPNLKKRMEENPGIK